MTNKMIQEKAEELFGKVDKTFPLSEFVKERDRKCFKQGAQWAKQQMIEEACEWLYDNIGGNIDSRISLDAFVDDFRKVMEE